MDITSGTSTAKLHDNIGRHQYNKHHEKRHHGQTRPTPNNGTTTKTRSETFINISNTDQKISKWIFQKHPHLCTRLGRSRNHVSKSRFKKEFNPTQHKGRRVPLHLTEKLENELRKLIEDKQIKKLTSCTDECFISPVVITVKSDQSIKIALDSKIP